MSADLKRLKPIIHEKNDKAAPSRFQRLLVDTDEVSHDACGPTCRSKGDREREETRGEGPTHHKMELNRLLGGFSGNQLSFSAGLMSNRSHPTPPKRMNKALTSLQPHQDDVKHLHGDHSLSKSQMEQEQLSYITSSASAFPLSPYFKEQDLERNRKWRYRR